MNKSATQTKFDERVEVLPPAHTQTSFHYVIVPRSYAEVHGVSRRLDVLLHIIAVPIAVGIGGIAAALIAHAAKLVS